MRKKWGKKLKGRQNETEGKKGSNKKREMEEEEKEANLKGKKIGKEKKN